MWMLRAIWTVAVNSAIGVRRVSRHQPREIQDRERDGDDAIAEVRCNRRAEDEARITNTQRLKPL